MFVNTDFISDIINDVFQLGKLESEELIFKEFKKFLTSLGLDVAISTFHLKPWIGKDSSITSGNGNSIGIYLRTTENFINNGFTENGNWNEKYKHTELIKNKWKELA